MKWYLVTLVETKSNPRFGYEPYYQTKIMSEELLIKNYSLCGTTPISIFNALEIDDKNVSELIKEREKYEISKSNY